MPRECPKCHENSLYLNKGIAENNDTYEVYKCSKCKHVEPKTDEPSTEKKPHKDFYQAVGEMLGEILRVVNEINGKQKKIEYKVVIKSPEEMAEWIKKHPGGIPVLEADDKGGYSIKPEEEKLPDVKDIPF